jgi:glutamine synthetase type III
MDKSDILNHDHLKETLTKKQERALKKIIKREEQIEKIKGEINEILNKNDLNVVWFRQIQNKQKTWRSK